MKRLLLLLLIFSASFSFGQETYLSYKNQTGTWNSYTNKWEFGEAHFANITFTITGSVVTCTDRALSVYRTKTNTKRDVNTDFVTGTIWECLDERNRRCKFSIYKTNDDDQIIYSVIYDNKVFRYYLGSAGLSTFN